MRLIHVYVNAPIWSKRGFILLIIVIPSSATSPHASTGTRPARGKTLEKWSGGDDPGAPSRYEGLQAIRLTVLGSYASGLTDTYQLTLSSAGTQRS